MGDPKPEVEDSEEESAIPETEEAELGQPKDDGEKPQEGSPEPEEEESNSDSIEE